jgi:GAF domain-containing protein
MSDTSRETKLNVAFVRLADTLTADFDVVDLLHTLVQECVDVLDTQAGGLMLSDAAGKLQLVASTSERADFVEIMQLNAGAGPCVDCFITGKAVVVADVDASEEWPEFRTAALQQGFHSVYSTPMKLRGEIIGTMNLFRTSRGELNRADAEVAQALADVATIGILQERIIRESSIVTEQLQRALDSRSLIEQAKGVLSQTANLDMHDAFTALRAYAGSNQLTLRSVAERVIDRSLQINAGRLKGNSQRA